MYPSADLMEVIRPIQEPIPLLQSLQICCLLQKAKCPNADGFMKSCGTVNDALDLGFDPRGDGEEREELLRGVWTKCGFDDAARGFSGWQPPPPLCEMMRRQGEGRMILGSWSRQELTDYPGNGRGGGVMVSQGQIQLLTATFVKFCSCAPCRNTNTVEQKYEDS